MATTSTPLRGAILSNHSEPIFLGIVLVNHVPAPARGLGANHSEPVLRGVIFGNHSEPVLDGAILFNHSEPVLDAARTAVAR
jgi:hypothetical protein